MSALLSPNSAEHKRLSELSDRALKALFGIVGTPNDLERVVLDILGIHCSVVAKKTGATYDEVVDEIAKRLHGFSDMDNLSDDEMLDLLSGAPEKKQPCPDCHRHMILASELRCDQCQSIRNHIKDDGG